MSTSTLLINSKFAVSSRAALAERATKIAVDRLNFYYGRTQALQNISIKIPEQMVMAFIGPSECGKTTFLRTLNRMNDVIPGTRVEGSVLMDEPASALDPIATSKIEELIVDLKKQYTIVIVTHNMQQAARVSDLTAFFLLGKLIEVNTTEKMFTAPAEKVTEDYITGRFG